MRAITDADLPTVTSFWVAAWQRTLPAIDFAARAPWLATHLGRLAAAGVQVLCAVDADDHPIGLLTIDAATGHIDQLAVAPDHFGTGIAEALLAQAHRRGPGHLHLTVNQDNPRAVAFYTRAGFGIVAEGVNPHSGLRTWDMVSPNRKLKSPSG
jgi:putative acetyltransferase